MSQRLQMLQVARLARRSLGDAADLVTTFLHGTAAPGGGYVNRGGRRDLYYSSFALDALVALDALDPQAPQIIATREWLEGYGTGDSLDLVHRCCLARAWASQPAALLADGLRSDHRLGEAHLESRVRSPDAVLMNECDRRGDDGGGE